MSGASRKLASWPRSTAHQPVRPRRVAITPPVEVSVVIPCLNEAENIQECVRRSQAALDGAGILGEVVVADNDSDDGSAELAVAAGARVVHEPRRGYGSAYLAGFAGARGEYIVMLDADMTYPFKDIPRFVEELRAGAQLVMGDRMDNIEPGAMHWMHRYIGNPLLSGTLNLFFRTGVRDAHCGMRGFRRDILPQLDLRATGMEFASEMVIRASKESLDIREFPISYAPRGGESKLSRYRDGWRHLRFLLVHSPTYLFIVPGAVLLLIGVLVIGDLAQPDADLRPRLEPPLAHRRRAACPSSACRSSRWASARTRTGRTSWARRTRGSIACARATGSSTV